MILIAVGANLPGPAGPPRAACEAAVRAIGSGPLVRVTAVSRWFETRPDPPEAGGPPYVNGVVRLAPRRALARAADAPATLLAALLAVETRFGRRRDRPNAPRTLDLDLIDMDGIRRDGPPDPVLPHPRCHDRRFVLVPLREVAPAWTHPRLGLPVDALLDRLPPDGVLALAPRPSAH